ncbi:hypothetical protein JCM1840_007178 [Sporobolomyces johnsonii]
MPDDHDPLSTLQSLFPSHPRASLKKWLDASSGNLERAFAAIERGQHAIVSSQRPTKRRRVDSAGLEQWLGAGKRKTERGTEVLVLDSSSDDEQVPPPTKLSQEPDSAQSKPLKSAFDLLRAPPSTPSPAAAASPAPSHTNLPPLVLATPAMVSKHTGGLVTLVENALPPDLASRLYVRMVQASVGEGTGEEPWKRNKWYLVDREVESPHTSQFFVEAPSRSASGSGYSEEGFHEAAQHWYNGEQRRAHHFLPEMDEARQLVASFVRVLLNSRKRHPLEYGGEWQPNVAAANCYRGAKESVGWHSDQLTYLGPYPTIASLTLGCTRPFRLRPFSPSSLPSSSTSSSSSLSPNPTMRTLEIPLPHNSVLIMHAGVQETFKHCVPPVGGMDVFRLPRGTLVPQREEERSEEEGGERPRRWSDEEVKELERRKWRERINMTFRHYRPDFAPRTPSSPPGYAGTPHCACGIPCILRPDGKGRVRGNLGPHPPAASGTKKDRDEAREGDEGEMVFFWSCNGGAQNEGKGCRTFRVLDMEKEGRGRWFRRDEGKDGGAVPGG